MTQIQVVASPPPRFRSRREFERAMDARSDARRARSRELLRRIEERYLERERWRALGLLGASGAPVANYANWTPKNLTTVTLYTLWDAYLGVFGTNVNTWVDQAGNFNLSNATSTEQPPYSATSFDGRPGVTFNGGQHNLWNGTGLANVLIGGEDTSFCIYWAGLVHTVPGANRSLIGIGSTTSGNPFAVVGTINSGSALRVTKRGADGADWPETQYLGATNSGLVLVGAVARYRWAISANQMTWLMNGATIISGSMNVPTMGSNMNRFTVGGLRRVGALETASNYTLAGMFTLSNIPSGGEDALCEFYVKQRWGTA